MDLQIDSFNIEPCLLPLLKEELESAAQQFLGQKHTHALATHIQSQADLIADSYRGRPATLQELHWVTTIFLQKLGLNP